MSIDNQNGLFFVAKHINAISQNLFDNYITIEAYLEIEFSRRFGRAEEDAFINGTGIDVPTGILLATGGGEVVVILDEGIDLSYDDVIKLYFSLKPEHRRNAVWLMNDESAPTLEP